MAINPFMASDKFQTISRAVVAPTKTTRQKNAFSQRHLRLSINDRTDQLLICCMHAIRTVAIKALAEDNLFAATVRLEAHNMIEQLSVLRYLFQQSEMTSRKGISDRLFGSKRHCQVTSILSNL